MIWTRFYEVLEVLSDALPVGEFHLQVFVVEEEGGLSCFAFQLPVQPLHHSLGIVATVLLVVGAAMTILGVQHHHGNVVGDTLVILLGIGLCDVARTANHIEHGLV